MLSVCSANSLMKYSDCSYGAISQRQFVQLQNPVTVNTFFIEFLPTQHIQLEKPTTDESHLQNVRMRLQLISNIICSLKMCLFSMVTKTNTSCQFIYHLKHFLCLVCNQPHTSHDNKNVLSTRTAKIYKHHHQLNEISDFFSETTCRRLRLNCAAPKGSQYSFYSLLYSETQADVI